MKRYSVVSLFSGCGGLDLGFHNHGAELIYACDFDSSAVKVFNRNLGNVAQVRDVEGDEFEKDLIGIGKADIVLGGFPCQGFSKSGPKKKDDPRNRLYLAMIKAIEMLDPEIFVAENVDGMAQNYKGEYLSRILEDFRRLGYHVEHRILNAGDFGVPQHRRRIIFIGQKDRTRTNFEWPKPTHFISRRNGEFKTQWQEGNTLNLFNSRIVPQAKTIQDAIEDLLASGEEIPDHTFIEPKENQKLVIDKIGLGQKLCNVRFSETSVYTWEIPEAFGEVSQREITLLETIGKNRRKKIYGDIPNGNPLATETVSKLSGINFELNEFEELEKKGYLKKIGGKFDLKGAMFCSGLYKRPKWEQPSPTVITVFDNPRFFVHPILNRPFTVRECARLQSFPDHFEFLSADIPIKHAYRLIGNAVPPLLAKKIAEQVLAALKNAEIDEAKTLQPNSYSEKSRV